MQFPKHQPLEGLSHSELELGCEQDVKDPLTHAEWQLHGLGYLTGVSGASFQRPSVLEAGWPCGLMLILRQFP